MARDRRREQDESRGARRASDARLDTRGKFCPLPVIETEAAMRGLARGQVLELLADDPGVKLDIPAWCRSQGQKLLGMEEADGVIRLRILKQAEIR